MQIISEVERFQSREIVSRHLANKLKLEKQYLFIENQINLITDIVHNLKREKNANQLD